LGKKTHTLKKLKTYRVVAMYGTRHYGIVAPKGWYEVKAKNKVEAVQKLAKKHGVPQKWVKGSPVFIVGK